MSRSRPVQPDHEDLAEALAVLASATRLDILAALRFPRTVRDLRIRPRRHRPGEDPERAISVPATRQHLAKLLDAGLVAAQDPAKGDAEDARRFVVNRPRLYALAQGFLQLSALHGDHGAPSEATATLGSAAPAVDVQGPRLVLVHGAYEGKAYALSAATTSGGSWILGRRPGLPICLDYDPFVSRDHAEIAPQGGHFLLRDRAGSHNGTWVNWRRLQAGEGRLLRPGDVVGVGRSLLVFAES